MTTAIEPDITREPELIAAERALVKTDKGSPLPVFTGAEMAHALTAYRELQNALDKSMPDQIMELDGKPFRKKGYWRAISVAFNLTVEPIVEERRVDSAFDDGRDNFGYVVTYRATAPNGRSVTGDGSCFAVEKARRFRCPHPHPRGWKGKSEHWPAEACPLFDPAFQWKTLPAQATTHNIRSHAHTRAFNRAVSNLVGFGEVSAEEVERETVPSREPETTTEAPAAPVVSENDGSLSAGFYYIHSYDKRDEWHEIVITNWDLQGGSRKFSTKLVKVGELMAQAYKEHIAVRPNFTMKRGSTNEAYLNGLEFMVVQPKAAPKPMLTADDITF